MNGTDAPPVARAEIVVDLAAIRHNVRTLRDLVGPRRRDDGGGQGRRLRPRDGRVRPGRPRRRRRVAGGRHRSTRRWRCARPATPAGSLLADRPGRGLRRRDRGGRRRHRLLRGRARRDRRRGAGDRTARGSSSRSTPGSAAAARRADAWPALFAARRGAGAGRPDRGHRRLVALLVSSDEPDDPANAAQEALFHEALDVAERAGLRPEVRHLANSAAAILRPSSRLDLVRVGIAAYGLDPAPGHTPDLGLVPAMTARATPGDGQARRGGRRGVLRADLDRRARDDARPGAGGVRRRHPARRRQPRRGAGSPARAGRSAAGSAWTSSSSTSATRTPAAGDGRRAVRARASTASPPRRTGRRPAARSATRSSPGSAAG